MNKLKLFGLMSIFASTTMMADPIDMEKAKQLAASLTDNATEPTLVKAATRNEAKSRTLDESTKATAPYYIFSRGENQGYIIVSGDDCLPEILGYTESGDFDEANLPPHLLNWLNHYANLIEEAQAQGVNTSASETKSRIEPNVRTATKVNIDPLVSAHWGQGWPYNNKCPFLTGTTNRAVTGCVATAASQVVYYWRKDNPSTLLNTTPTYGYGDAPVTESYPAGTPMKWELMLDHYNDAHPAEYEDAVATLNAALGAATWLTYGSSTSGQISNLVHTFNSYFRLSSESRYKGGETQAAWENLIYNELSNGRPIVYSGVHATNGGHAVVLDGYQASTNFFHFNFGWGGQGDGWYTVDDETGMNMFNSSQGMVFNIQPKQRNISAEIIPSGDIYLNSMNNIRIKVNNNSTLDFSGLYLFASTSSKPTSLSAAKDEDTETIISSDGSDTYITLQFKPTLEREYKFWVTDANMTVLATDTIMPMKQISELHLLGMDIYGTNITEKHGDEEFKVVYHSNKAVCEVEIANHGNINYEGSPKLELYGSKDDGATFELIGTKTGKLSVEAGKSEKFTVNIISTSSCPIEQNVLYRGRIVNPIKSLSASDTLQYANSDTIVRFVLRDGSMEVASYENRCLKLTGQWDYNKFISLTNTSTYKDATSIDLTEVEGVGSQPVFEHNPNALFYAADDAFTAGTNIVKKSDASCANLSLTAGYSFQPQSDINVGKYTLNIAQTPNHWYMLTSPCAVKVPHGIIAREVNSHSKTSGINNKTTNVTSLEAGKAYLVMASSTKKQTLTSGSSVCVMSPVANTDTAFIGTFIAKTVPVGAMLIDHTDDYFRPLEEEGLSEGLRGYFNDAKTTRAFRAYSNMLIDNPCIELGNAIDSCYAAMDAYADMASEQALKNLADSIALAEQIFSERTLTKLEITNFTEDLLLCMENAKQQSDVFDSDAENDYTGFIANPSFEKGNTTGWTVGSTTAATVKSATNIYYKGVGSDGKYLLSNINTADSTGVAISQTVTGLVPGTYRLTAMVGTSEGRTVTMFANDQKTTVEAHPFGKFYLTEAVIDNVIVGEDGTLNLGVEAGDWYKADDFRLTLIEEGIADAIGSVVDDAQPSISVVSVAGGISITTTDATPVAIHSIAGIRVWNESVNGTTTVALPAGIYIVGGKKVAVY